MDFRFQSFIYETDTNGSWGLGHIKVARPICGDVTEIFQEAKRIGGRLVVIPSRGNY